MRSSFDIITINDVAIILIDLNKGRSVSSDAPNVVNDLQKKIPGGIGYRRIFFRNSKGRYDQLLIKNDKFIDFAPCTNSQQKYLSMLVESRRTELLRGNCPAPHSSFHVQKVMLSMPNPPSRSLVKSP